MTNIVCNGKKEIDEIVKQEINSPASGPYRFDPFGLNEAMKSSDDYFLKTTKNVENKFLDVRLSITLSALNDKIMYKILALIKSDVIDSEEFKNRISLAIASDIAYFKSIKKPTFADELFSRRCQDILNSIQIA